MDDYQGKNIGGETIEDVWLRYKNEGDESSRNSLVGFYYPIVRKWGAIIAGKTNRKVDVEDLAQEGVFGLIDAIQKYDLSSGIKFETFSSHRVRGSMIDYLRSLDWYTRTARERARIRENAVEDFEKEFGFKPCREEIRLRLINERELSNYEIESVVNFRRSKNYSLDSCIEDKFGNEFEFINVLEGSDFNLRESIDDKDLRDFMLDGFSRRDKLILTLRYYEGMTLDEIGKVIGVSEAFISQKHKSLLKILKSKITGHPERYKSAICS